MRRSYTVLVLADGRARFRRFRVGLRTLWGGAAVGVVALAAVVGFGLWQFVGSPGTSPDVSALRAENSTLRAEKAEFEEALAHVAGRLNRFEAQAGRMARELGLDDGFEPDLAAGGPGDVDPEMLLDIELNALGHRAADLDDSMVELDRVFRERIQMLAATPNSMPADGWFSHGFGWRRDPWTGDREFHRGVDIVADQGTPVVAPADGMISRATRVSDYGKVIDMSHGLGYVTRYAHLSEILVKPGQKVKRGDLIARIGSTGRSTGPHLHYEVFRDGRRVNPWKYLGQR